jgi:SAM-dependent methyltransferase
MSGSFVAEYWESRYARGGNSGAGSYGSCLDNKKALISGLLEERGIHSVVDLGCGDGTVIDIFRDLGSYIGYDVSRTAIDRLVARGYPGHYQFRMADGAPPEHAPDLAMSLDVVFHLVEDAVFRRYMGMLTGVGARYLLVLTWNSSILSTEHTVGSHVLYRDFRACMEEDYPGYRLVQEYPYELPTSTYYLYEAV